MSLEVVAELTGISRSYLAMLERGERRFDRRGLLEDVAAALGCAPTELTGQPHPAQDRATVEALSALTQISVAPCPPLMLHPAGWATRFSARSTSARMRTPRASGAL